MLTPKHEALYKLQHAYENPPEEEAIVEEGVVMETADESAEEKPLPTSQAQLDVINHREGPCLVIAAPGSGKTWTITKRFISLVQEGVEPEEVKALTFNNAAAKEMNNRVEGELGALKGTPLTTYNAFGSELIQQFGHKIGLPPTVRIASATEQMMYLKEAIEEVHPASIYNPTRPYDAVRNVQSVIQKAKQEMLMPEEYVDLVDEGLKTSEGLDTIKLEIQRSIAEIYQVLQAKYKADGLVDHDDCINLAAEIIDKVPEAREYCNKFKYVMVDEYQDTNTAQAVLVERLVGHRGNLLVVADDDQAIYRFRGASRANIERFREAFPNAREIGLLENRRSTNQIVNASHAVISTALSRENKKAIPVRGDGPKIRIISAPDQYGEASAIAERIQEFLAADKDLPLNEIAVLVRNRKEMEAISSVLQMAKIPYVAIGGVDFFSTPEIKSVMALFEAIVNPNESQALVCCLQLPGWEVSSTARYELIQAAHYLRKPLLEIMANPDGIVNLNEEDKAAVLKAAEDFPRLHSLALQDDVRSVFIQAMQECQYAGISKKTRKGVERQQIGANLTKLYEILNEFCDYSGDTSLMVALEYLKLMKDAGHEGIAPLSDDSEGVRLSTIHGAKGLEWKHVIVAACVEGKLPTRELPDMYELPASFVPTHLVPSKRLSLEQTIAQGNSIAEQTEFELGLQPVASISASKAHDTHLQEELRLFYVAATRAKNSLTLTWAQRYPSNFKSSKAELQKPSQFLACLPKELVETKQNLPTLYEQPTIRKIPEKMRVPLNSVSYSSLTEFKTCPAKYAFDKIWHIPSMFSPEPRFGTLVHKTLHQAMSMVTKGLTVDGDVIQKLWETNCNGPNGMPPSHDKLRVEGTNMLIRYLNSPLWKAARPHLLEEPFTIEINNIPIPGRFDRVDMVNGVPKVIDYKTGNPGNQKGLKHNIQLKIYALAVMDLFKVNEVECEIHWLQNNTASTIVYTKEDLKTAKWQLENDIQSMQAAHNDGVFEAIPTKRNCSSCSHVTVCDQGRVKWKEIQAENKVKDLTTLPMATSTRTPIPPLENTME